MNQNSKNNKRIPSRRPSPWAVYFDGNFCGSHGRERKGLEIAVDREFHWGGSLWRVPAVYLCARGLVVEFCMRIEPERIRDFVEKWDLTPENEHLKEFTGEDLLIMDAENPLTFDFTAEAVVNGRKLRPSHSCGVTYNPLWPDEVLCQLDALQAVEHYRLDPSCGWMICRTSFPWAAKRRPQVQTLSVFLDQNPTSVPGPHFQASEPGVSFSFVFPPTGQEHTLTVRDLQPRTLDHSSPSKSGIEDLAPAFSLYDFPSHYVEMTYTVTPELSEKAFAVLDCAESDRPRAKSESISGRKAAASIAVLCGSSGAGTNENTETNRSGSKQTSTRLACSSLHFEPAEQVEWRLQFYWKRENGVSVEII